jgi:hypothetical protein
MIVSSLQKRPRVGAASACAKDSSGQMRGNSGNLYSPTRDYSHSLN